MVLAIGQLLANIFNKGLLKCLLWVAVNFLHSTICFTVRCYLHFSHSGGFAYLSIKVRVSDAGMPSTKAGQGCLSSNFYHKKSSIP